MKKEYVEDIIKDEYKQWKVGDDVTINFQTGGHKTTFILEIFAPYISDKEEPKILYLVPRKKLLADIEKLINKQKIKNIVLMTYQTLENKIQNGDLSLSNYEYIVCDECHYFITDAWNKKTQISWMHLIKQKALRIWMSGTGRHVFKFVKNVQTIKKEGGESGELYKYWGKFDYSYIEKIYFYSKKEKLEYIKNVLNSIPVDEKAIYFCSDKKFGNKIFKCLNRPTLYYTSDIKKSNKYEEAIIEEEKFKEDFLIATSVLDTGISLTEKNIKHIITDIPNVETLVQCIGRRRIENDEKIILHICNYSESEINQVKKLMTKEIKEIKTNFLQGGKEGKMEFLKKFENDRKFPKNKYLYYSVSDQDIKLNHIFYIADEFNYEDFNIEIYKGFAQWLLEAYLKGIPKTNIIYLKREEKLQNHNELVEFLKLNMNKKLFVEEQKPLMAIMKKLINTRYKTIKIWRINKYLSENNINYTLDSGKEGNSSQGNRMKNYIIIKETETK